MKILIVFIVGLFLVTGCDEESTAPENSIPTVNAYQVGKCQQIGLTKSSFSDSCFSYQFKDTLSFDFCIYGNCCPDSNRFEVKNSITLDTITIVAVDTAENLCRCLCNYIIHGTVTHLEKDIYVVKCIRKDAETENVLYSVTVNRH